MTFIRNADESDALLRIGGYPDTVEARSIKEMAALMESFDAGFPTMGAALNLGSWSVVIEPDGFSRCQSSRTGRSIARY